jgi:hypothetical protein
MVMAGSGCSGSEDNLPREAISGTVTLDGQPLATGNIQFTPSAGANTPGDIVVGGSPIMGGRFAIAHEKGLIPGSYKVTVNSSSGGPAGAPKAEPAGRGKPSERPKEIIPAKYNSETTLIADVKKGGSNDFKFALESAK